MTVKNGLLSDHIWMAWTLVWRPPVHSVTRSLPLKCWSMEIWGPFASQRSCVPAYPLALHYAPRSPYQRPRGVFAVMNPIFSLVGMVLVLADEDRCVVVFWNQSHSFQGFYVTDDGAMGDEFAWTTASPPSSWEHARDAAQRWLVNTATNNENISWEEWRAAAGLPEDGATPEHHEAWRQGEDPCEYRGRGAN